MSKQRKKNIVFFGDSITQMGDSPGGYLLRMRQILDSMDIEQKYELTGRGIGGNKVHDLYLRMDDDVLAKNPDIVVIWIGVNDVWHKLLGSGTEPHQFEKFYTAIIKRLQDADIELILVTPGAIGERNDLSNQQDGDLNLYSDIIRKLANEYECKLADIRKDFIAYGKQHNPANKESGILTTDGVHLSATGNQFVAEKLVETLLRPSKGVN